MPGVVVDGWTNRPTVAPELVRIWNSYCDFVRRGAFDSQTVATWIDRVHWREDEAGRALLFGVFVDLIEDRAKLLAPAAITGGPADDE